jgi:hypothetical protein
MADGYTEFGFNWGPAEVTRCCELPDGRRVVQVKTPHKTLDIYISATGRSVRVFSEGYEWGAPEAAA